MHKYEAARKEPNGNDWMGFIPPWMSGLLPRAPSCSYFPWPSCAMDTGPAGGVGKGQGPEAKKEKSTPKAAKKPPKVVLKGDLDSSRGFWKGLGKGTCPGVGAGMGREAQGMQTAPRDRSCSATRRTNHHLKCSQRTSPTTALYTFTHCINNLLRTAVNKIHFLNNLLFICSVSFFLISL